MNIRTTRNHNSSLSSLPHKTAFSPGSAPCHSALGNQANLQLVLNHGNTGAIPAVRTVKDDSSAPIQYYRILETHTDFVLAFKARRDFEKAPELRNQYGSAEDYINHLKTPKTSVVFDSNKKELTELAKDYDAVQQIISCFKLLMADAPDYKIEFDNDEKPLKKSDYLLYLTDLVNEYNGGPPSALVSKSPDAPPSSLVKNKATLSPSICAIATSDSVTEARKTVESELNILNWNGGERGWAEDIFEFSQGTMIGRPSQKTGREDIIDEVRKAWGITDPRPGDFFSRPFFSFGSNRTVTGEDIAFFAEKGMRHQIHLSMVDGGNMLLGTDFALIGHDSLYATMKEYSLTEGIARVLIASELALRPADIYFLKQLDYHIDTYLQLLSGRTVLLSMPPKCNKTMYVMAIDELKAFGFTVIETDIPNAVNGEFVLDGSKQLIYLSNHIPGDKVDAFKDLMFKNVPYLKAIYITTKGLNNSGGIGCMFKGLPTPPSTSAFPVKEDDELPQEKPLKKE